MHPVIRDVAAALDKAKIIKIDRQNQELADALKLKGFYFNDL
jgi:hypothetical protein